MLTNFCEVKQSKKRDCFEQSGARQVPPMNSGASAPHLASLTPVQGALRIPVGDRLFAPLPVGDRLLLQSPLGKVSNPRYLRSNPRWG